jgi:ABC-type transporter MlaC component
LRYRPYHTIMLAAQLMAASALPASALSDSAIRDFVAYIGNSIRSMHAQDQAHAQRTPDRCGDFLSRVLDIETMTRTAATDVWDRMSPTQRRSYRAAFQARLVTECLRAVRRYRGEQITLAGIRSNAQGERLATVRFSLPDEPGRMVTWRLRGSDRPRAVDVITDGRSTVIAAREEQAAVLRSTNGDIDAMIQSMHR